MGDFLCMASSECCCVEEAKAAGKVHLSVMAWRTDDGHGIIYLQPEDASLDVIH